ncbi:MAG TPA: glutathione S-transferase [Stellaceae bacterium]|nr:glutathione S-transferase [Stellaceae bacterium]
MLKIWGRASSANVMKVLWCCTELNERYERLDVGGPYGGNDEPAYRAMNPNGRVPTVEENGVVMWESNSVVRYLCTTRRAEKLYPTDPGKRSFVERWMDWQLAHCGPDTTPLFMGYVRTPPEKRDPAALERARKVAIPTWQIAEDWLAHQKWPYLAGQDFTIGDIPVAIFARRWFAFPIERPSMPHLEAWYDRVKTRPGFVEHIAVPMV